MNKEFDNETVYRDSDKYVKTELKSCRDKINTSFRYLEECKYEIKKNKMENLINDNLKPSSSNIESDNESNNESDSESDNIPDNESSNLSVEN